MYTSEELKEFAEKFNNGTMETVRVRKPVIDLANTLIYPYQGWQSPSMLHDLTDTLAKNGINIGALVNPVYDVYPDSRFRVDWYFEGKKVENSVFVVEIHEGEHTNQNEYVMYFS